MLRFWLRFLCHLSVVLEWQLIIGCLAGLSFKRRSWSDLHIIILQILIDPATLFQDFLLCLSFFESYLLPLNVFVDGHLAALMDTHSGSLRLQILIHSVRLIPWFALALRHCDMATRLIDLWLEGALLSTFLKLLLIALDIFPGHEFLLAQLIMPLHSISQFRLRQFSLLTAFLWFACESASWLEWAMQLGTSIVSWAKSKVLIRVLTY